MVLKSMQNISKFRVYYEDTDSGGVVYYANYLRFAERARTELLRSKGINQLELIKSQDILFVVKHAELDLKFPARLDDLLEIHSKIESISGASIKIYQQITCNSKNIADIKVLVVSVNSRFKPKKLPLNIVNIIR